MSIICGSVRLTFVLGCCVCADRRWRIKTRCLALGPPRCRWHCRLSCNPRLSHHEHSVYQSRTGHRAPKLPVGFGRQSGARQAQHTLMAVAASAVSARQTAAFQPGHRLDLRSLVLLSVASVVWPAQLPRRMPACETVAMVYWDTMLCASSSTTLQSRPHMSEAQEADCLVIPRERTESAIVGDGGITAVPLEPDLLQATSTTTACVTLPGSYVIDDVRLLWQDGRRRGLVLVTRDVGAHAQLAAVFRIVRVRAAAISRAVQINIPVIGAIICECSATCSAEDSGTCLWHPRSASCITFESHLLRQWPCMQSAAAARRRGCVAQHRSGWKPHRGRAGSPTSAAP